MGGTPMDNSYVKPRLRSVTDRSDYQQDLNQMMNKVEYEPSDLDETTSNFKR